MVIPIWTLWIIGWGLILATSCLIMSNASEWDFMSPILAAGIIIIGFTFTLGYFIGGC
jgi:hypothetical protein